MAYFMEPAAKPPVKPHITKRSVAAKTAQIIDIGLSVLATSQNATDSATDPAVHAYKSATSVTDSDQQKVSSDQPLFAGFAYR